MGTLDAVRQLLNRGYRQGPENLPELAIQAAALIGFTGLTIYVVDHQQRVLLPLPGSQSPPVEAITVDGSPAGQAFSTLSAVTEPSDTATHLLWVPLLNGSERLGVLQATAPAGFDRHAVADCLTVAAIIAELIETGDLHSDTIERLRRREPMHLAAEMLRAQLPPLTFATDHTVIAGILEPCYDVGGDAFDYAVNGNTAHLALFDAIGHGSTGGMRAVVLASIALAAYRNARRTGLDLTATYRHLDNAVRAHDRTGYITAILAELDQHTGILHIISAGHPSGLILRRSRVATILPTPTALPVTLGHRRPPVVIQENLEPGDQVLLYTDGITEARDHHGTFFGTDRLIDFAQQAAAEQLPAPETARRLVHAILNHQNNHLQDDATILLMHWLGPHTNPYHPQPSGT